MRALPILRTAELADLPELLRLEAQFVGDRLSPRQLSYHLRQADRRLRVCAIGSELHGYSLTLRRRDSTVARLYSLVVDQAMRGSGLGKKLLGDAEIQAQHFGASCVRLEVRADNAAALALYVRAGYHVFGQHKHYYDDGMDAVRLQKALDVPVGAPEGAMLSGRTR